MSKNLNELTGFLELEGGTWPCGLPGGPTTGPCGPEVAPVSRSVSPASERGPATNATCGPKCDGWSTSADLQRVLASKLRQRLGDSGSLEYKLTWKDWDMKSGPPICALRASARRSGRRSLTKSAARSSTQVGSRPVLRIYGKGFGGWPSPKKRDGHAEGLRAEMNLVGYPTPSARDWKNGQSNQFGKNARPLSEVALLTGRRSPNAIPESRGGLQSNPQKALERLEQGHTLNLDDQVCLTGPTLPSSTVSTAGRAGFRLNPSFSRWLQGYPPGWDDCGVTAMQSSPRWRRNSLKRSLTP